MALLVAWMIFHVLAFVLYPVMDALLFGIFNEQYIKSLAKAASVIVCVSALSAISHIFH